MEIRQVGTSGLQLPVLGLGTLTWGYGILPDDAAALLSTLVEAGGQLVDIAEWYGDATALEVLGAILESGISRDDILINLKGAWRSTRGSLVRDTSRGGLIRSIDSALSRLGTDHVDIFTVDGHDGITPWTEIAGTLKYMVDTGRARYVGVSGVRSWEAARLASLLEARAVALTVLSDELSLSAPPVVAQGAIAREFGAGVIGTAPLGRGVLTGKYRRTIPANSRAADSFMSPYVHPYLNERGSRIVEAISVASNGLDLSATQIALAWSLSLPTVAAVVAGPRTTGQLDELILGASVDLPGEVAGALSTVVEGDR